MFRRLLLVLLLALIGGVFYLNTTHKTQISPLLLSGSTMGTTYHLKIILPSQGEFDTEKLNNSIRQGLDRVDQLMSTYKPDSEISRFNRLGVGQWLPISQETLLVITTARDISASCNGAFDITVGKLVNLWGFGPTINASVIPDAATVENLRRDIGYTKLKIQTEPPEILKESNAIYLDLSAIAKGYAVDVVAAIIEQSGITDYMVEIGGEIRTAGTKTGGKAWSIGIESPLAGERSVQKILHLHNSAMATSGDYRNYFEHEGQRFSHTIDPRTGHPITHKLASVTVITDSCMHADALATALMVLGPEEGLAFAQQQQLAVFMIIKTDSGFAERYSPAFAPYLQHEAL